MRLSKELTLSQTLSALAEAGFNNRFRILGGHKKWAIVLVHQIGEKRPKGKRHIDGSSDAGTMGP